MLQFEKGSVVAVQAVFVFDRSTCWGIQRVRVQAVFLYGFSQFTPLCGLTHRVFQFVKGRVVAVHAVFVVRQATFWRIQRGS